MTKSTRTTFTAGQGRTRPTVSAVELLSQSLRDRAEQQQAAVAQQPNAPALAAPGGRVQRLGGGNEPLQPRADQSTGAIPVGGVVQVNQGVRTGQPAGGATATPQPQPMGWLQGEGDPNEAGRVPRARGDRYYDKVARTLWVWQQTGDETAEWVVVARGTGERTIGIENPVVGNVYPLMAVADARYLLLSLSIRNTTPTGGSAATGAATVVVNGVAAVLGTTVVEADDFVGLRVDAMGSGILSASVVAGLA